jgi:hypothetical protein
MQIYKHTQVGMMIILALGLGIVIIATFLIVMPVRPIVPELSLGILFLCLLLFSALTVEVTMDKLLLSFGPGLIRKSFHIEDIRNAKVVRNPWYYGWGIRSTPHGWLFNVSGLDAVELELKNSRRFRIGTDDPQELLRAIQQASHLVS